MPLPTSEHLNKLTFFQVCKFRNKHYLGKESDMYETKNVVLSIYVKYFAEFEGLNKEGMIIIMLLIILSWVEAIPGCHVDHVMLCTLPEVSF